jgi:hypothetical protein
MYRYCFVISFLILFGFSAQGTTEGFALQEEVIKFTAILARHLPATESRASLVDESFFKDLKDEYPFIVFDNPKEDADITEHMSHAGYIPQGYTGDPMILGVEEYSLCTHQLANCLGVAIYNTETKKRSLWHFYAFNHERYTSFQEQVVRLIRKIQEDRTSSCLQITGVTGFLTDCSVLYMKLLIGLFPEATIQLRAYEQLLEYRKKEGVTDGETSVLFWFSSEKQKEHFDHERYHYTSRALSITADGVAHYGSHNLTLGKFPLSSPRPVTKPDTLTDGEWAAYERQLEKSSFHSNPAA